MCLALVCYILQVLVVVSLLYVIDKKCCCLHIPSAAPKNSGGPSVRRIVVVERASEASMVSSPVKNSDTQTARYLQANIRQ